MYDYVEFSFVSASVLIAAEYIFVEKHTVVNFTSNIFTDGIDQFFAIRKFRFICMIQYGNRSHAYDVTAMKILQKTKKNYMIIFKNNSGNKLFNSKCATSHCSWVTNAAFITSNPKEINYQLIGYENNTFKYRHDEIKNQLICVCTDDQTFDCTAEGLPPVYPGQRYSLKLTAFNTAKTVVVYIDQELITSCKSKTNVFSINVFSGNCTAVDFTFVFQSRNSCELFIVGYAMGIKTFSNEFANMIVNQDITSVYHVEAMPCPQGFTLNTMEGVCQCDHLLTTSVLSVTTCNITDQTILFPANSWVSARTINGSHIYHISLQCPFDYCRPYPSHINLSTPDSLCQFKRTGLFCAKCQHDLSALFGSSQCKQCSNFYLLIIIPLSIAGILLVMVLFVFNLTVTNGDINAMLFYANVVGINTAVMQLSNKLANILISLANL